MIIPSFYAPGKVIGTVFEVEEGRWPLAHIALVAMSADPAETRKISMYGRS